MRRRPTATGRARLSLALLLAVCINSLFIAGCGGGQKSTIDKERSGAPTTTASTTESTTAISAANSAVQHVLERSTSRPPNVGAQFEFVGGAGPGPCLTVRSPPAVHVYVEPFPSTPASPNATINTYRSGRISFGQSADVCFNGLGLGSARVSVTGPAGFHEVGTLDSHTPNECPNGDCAAGWDWVPAVDESWPVGLYHVSARSAHAQVSTSFRVVPPTTPGIRVLGPSTDPGHNEVAPNAQAHVFLTGFRSVKSIRLVVYRLEGLAGNARFFSTANVPLPSTGQTIVTLPTGDPAANATYLLTAKYDGVVYFAPLAVAQPYKSPSIIVGPLPTG
jgi:hypothetical protein